MNNEQTNTPQPEYNHSDETTHPGFTEPSIWY